MSPATDERVHRGGRPPRLAALQPAAIVWLTVVWVGLWGDLSFANVVSGIVLGSLVCFVFPLPPVRMRVRVRPLWALWLGVKFVLDVVVASAEVAWVTLTRRNLRNAVIEVNLRSPSDFVLTVVAELTSLVPGSVVVEARRSSHTLFLHVLDTPNRSAAEGMRQRTLKLEHRVVMATGADRITAEEQGAAS